MVEFLLFCLAAVGMTSIIVQGRIFQPFRQFIGNWAEKAALRREENEQATGIPSRRALTEWFNDLINCAQCTGFWCGLFCGMFFISTYYQASDFPLLNLLLMWFCCGVAGSYLASFGCNAVDWMFYRKMNALRQLEEQDLILADLYAQREHHHEHEHQEHHHDH